MVENYLLARKAVLEKIPADSGMVPFLTCALYGLLCKYDQYKDIILSVFSEVKFVFDTGTISEIIHRHDMAIYIADPIPEDSDSNIASFGASDPGHAFIIDDDGTIHYEKERPFIACSINQCSTTYLLNTFCHEMGHLIKGAVNNCTVKKKRKRYEYCLRTGISLYHYYYKKGFDSLTFSSTYSIMDEVINTIQTTDVMKEILGLEEFVDDEEILSFLQSLDRKEMNVDCGYEDLVYLLRLFWKNKHFRDTIEDNIVLGNIDAIIKDFDSIMGKGAFDEMSQLLENIYNLPDQVEDSDLDSFVKPFADLADRYLRRMKAKEKRL